VSWLRDPWNKYTTAVKTIHGVEVRLDPDTGRFAFKIGHRVTERKDLKAAELAINKLAARDPQPAMLHAGSTYDKQPYRKVMIAAKEPPRTGRSYETRYRTDDGNVISGSLFVLDLDLLVDFEQLAQERATARQKFEDRDAKLRERLVPFEFKVQTIVQPVEPKPGWHDFGTLNVKMPPAPLSDMTPGTAPDAHSGDSEPLNQEGATSGR
jgi:hypothetical protein